MKYLGGLAGLLLLAGSSAQPPDSCETQFSVSACRGDLACIREAQEARAACRASHDRGNGSVIPVSEPGTVILLAAGLVALVVARKKRSVSSRD
jgi:hypothetical protein